MPLFYHIKRLHAPHKLRMSPFSFDLTRALPTYFQFLVMPYY